MPKRIINPHAFYVRLMECVRAWGVRTGTPVEEKDLWELIESDNPQKTNGWKRRGVSVEGARDAARIFGCNAEYILTGQNQDTTAPAYSLMEALQVVAAHLRGTPPPAD